eukprot:COSAG02_NODE_3274_length_7030_cov_14.860008_5_plen_124_part_00
MALVGYGAHAGLVPEMQVDLDKFGSNHSLGATVEQATTKAFVLSANIALAPDMRDLECVPPAHSVSDDCGQLRPSVCQRGNGRLAKSTTALSECNDSRFIARGIYGRSVEGQGSHASSHTRVR